MVDREIKPKTIVFGTPVAYECNCGCGHSYLIETGEKMKRYKGSFSDLIGYTNNKKCYGDKK